MSRAHDSKNDKNRSMWSIAADKAREEIAKSRVRISMLENSVKIFIKKEKDGEPWPEMEKGTAAKLR